MATRRRDRNPKASAIVLGVPASAILHHGRTAHLLPHHSSDHPGRYKPGQRLAVKTMVPGPTECHVTLTTVNGPRQRFTLGQITIADARALGHTRLDTLWRHWITNNDQEWLGRQITAGTDTDTEIARRFNTRWSSRLTWLLRFELAATIEPPRLLAAGGGCNWQEIREAQEAREHFRAPRDTEADHGYTASDSRSLDEAGVGLTDTQWETHIGPKSPYRTAERLATKRAMTWQVRLADAKEEARRRSKDIRDECRRFDKLIREDKMEKAIRQLELIEQRVYQIAA